MNTSAALSSPFYCGCETEPAQGALLSVDAALRKGLALAETVVEVERLPLEKAHGRVLSHTMRAKTSLPLFDNAAMAAEAGGTGGGRRCRR